MANRRGGLAACAGWLSYAEYEDIPTGQLGVGGPATAVASAVLTVSWLLYAGNGRSWDLIGIRRNASEVGVAGRDDTPGG